MPYLGPASKARKAVAERSALVANGGTVDTLAPEAAAMVARAVAHGVSEGVAIGGMSPQLQGRAKSYARQLARRARNQQDLRAELERAGLTSKRIAQMLARAAGRIESDDPQQAQVGAKAMHLVLKLRGDLIPVQATGPVAPPESVNILVAVLSELRNGVSAPPLDVTAASRNIGQAPQEVVVDVTPPAIIRAKPPTSGNGE